MVVYSYGREGLVSRPSLLEALRFPNKDHLTVCLTGGGGKTSVMYRLADELAARGKCVIVTTTTHIFRPSDRMVIETARAGTVGAWIAEHNTGSGVVLVAGQLEESPSHTDTAEFAKQRERKLKSLPLSEISELSAIGDVLLIEADGAKRLPVKVPREGEPVIPPETDVVVGCVGLDCVGQPLETVCFRSELAEELLHRPKTHRITAADAAKILTDSRGTKKEVGNAAYRVVLNKADNEDRCQKAVEIMNKMRETGDGSELICAVTSFLC